MLILLGGAGLGLILFFPAIRSGSARLLFRALVPAWRYFDREEPMPVLYVCRPGSSRDENAAEKWERVSSLHQLRPLDFLCNPFGNLALLEDSLLRLGVSDETVMEPWLRERVRQEVKREGLAPDAIRYRVDLEDPVSGATIRIGAVRATGGDSA